MWPVPDRLPSGSTGSAAWNGETTGGPGCHPDASRDLNYIYNPIAAPQTQQPRAGQAHQENHTEQNPIRPKCCTAPRGTCTTRNLLTPFRLMRRVIENTENYPRAQSCCNIFSRASALPG